jgi:threonine synthase
MEPWHGLINYYKAFLPVSENTPVITLNEGNTPLIKASHINEVIQEEVDLRFKYEGANPSGSFKDRGMTLAISKAVEEKSRAVICASTGNTSASASAYAAKADISTIVLIPEGKIAMGKLAQAMIHGAMVIQIEGNFDNALEIVKEIVAKHSITLVNSLNPFRIEGQKAYWKGYKEYSEAGKIGLLPVMLGFQAAGAAPIVIGRPVENPETVATAIRIGNPASWKGAEAARDESGGLINAVTDDEILDAYKFIASREGIFCEPASAASLAGVIKLSKQKFFSRGDTIVCTLTGNGLKDPDNAINISKPPIKVKADVKAVEDVLRGCCI